MGTTAFFEADDLVVTQHFTASADGTRVPYFLAEHRDSIGPGPTLLGGYGAVRRVWPQTVFARSTPAVGCENAEESDDQR